MIKILHGNVYAESNGVKAQMPIKDFVENFNQVSTGDLVLPDGVKAVIPCGNRTMFVYEMPPKVHGFYFNQFIEGPRNSFSLALPYIIFITVVFPGFPDDFWGGVNYHSRPCLAYFRNSELTNLDDPLYVPCLPNWDHEGLCMFPNYGKVNKIKDLNLKMREIFKEIIRSFTGAKFTGSLGGYSRLFAARNLDPRLQTLSAWEENSKINPNFILEIPWKDSQRTIRKIAYRFSCEIPRELNLQNSLEKIVFG